MVKKKKINLKSIFNLVTFLFLIVMGYLLICVVISHTKKNLTVYEVSNSDISDTIKGTGVIIRTEKVYKTEQDGYVISYLSDGDRVKNGGVVYAIDQTGEIQKKVNDLLTSDKEESGIEKTKVSDDLDAFIESYTDSDFYMVSETENELEHDIMSYTGTIVSENKADFEKEFKNDVFTEVQSKAAGLVSYSCDGLEELTRDSIKADVFNHKVRMEDLRTKDAVSQDTEVYRLTTSQNWSIIIPLSSDDYDHIKSKQDEKIAKIKANLEANDATEEQIENADYTTYMDIVIEKDELSLNVPYDCFEKDDQGYVELQFSNYVQRYLNQRYLSVKMVLNQGSGLKIPTSALVEKTAFRVPEDYLCKAGNSSTDKHVLLVYKTKDGEEKSMEVPVYVFNRSSEEVSDDDQTSGTDDSNIMISIMSDQLKEGDYIQKEQSNEKYPLEKVVTAYGVYTVNSGYCVYNYVDITERNEDYCIVSKSGSDISLYDRIMLNSDSVEENEIIY